MSRFAVLPSRGKLLVSTDLHGNGDDFRALRARFEGALAIGEDVHWALLGDLVHAPSPQARSREPELYDFEDESGEIVTQVTKLRSKHPGRVWVVLGNHDYGHIGGERTSKFYPDEVAHLEASLGDEQVATMKELFAGAHLALAAPCGVLMAHGSPGRELRSPQQLNAIQLERPRTAEEANLLRELLTSYGQPSATTEAMLHRMSDATGLGLKFVVHGHDRDPTGWFTEGGNQLQPVLFGARPQERRYLELDLAARYEHVEAIRDGVELLRLHTSSGVCPA